MVYANIDAYVETGTTAGNSSAIGVRITDTSNTIVQEMDKQLLCRTPANALNAAVGTISFSFLANVNTTTTYKIRGRRIDGSGVGTAGIYNQAAVRSQFYAIRIA
jgi:hypothetical protein